jgi:hypothetical protein
MDGALKAQAEYVHLESIPTGGQRPPAPSGDRSGASPSSVRFTLLDEIPSADMPLETP